MAEEATYVLQEAGLSDAAQTVNKTRQNTIRKNEASGLSHHYQSYYENVDAADIQALQKLYSFDNYVLQYPITPLTDFGSF